MGGGGGNLGTNLCFQTPGLEPSWPFFLIPRPRLHTSLPSKPQFRVSHGGAVGSGTVNTGGWSGAGVYGEQRSSEMRLLFGDRLLIAEGLRLKLWSLGTLSVLFY